MPQKPKNAILVKDIEGQVRETTYNLPQQNHAYGKKVQDDPEPIKHVVNGWQSASDSQQQQSKQKNYQKLNKMSTGSGLYTAKQQTQFRKNHDEMVQTKMGKKTIPIMIPQQEFTYGVPNRPSTPIKLVVGNCYGLEQQQNNQNQRAEQTQKLQAKKTKSQLLREQKAKQSKEYLQQPIFQEKFKIAKFGNTTTSKINTNLKQKINNKSNNTHITNQSGTKQ